MTRPRFFWLLLPLLVVACSKQTETIAKGGDKSPAAPVTLAAAVQGNWQQPVEGIATLRAQEAVTLTAPEAGRVEAILFREGTPVAAGTPLLRLEDDEQQAEFNAAKVNAELQQTRYNRSQTLRTQGLLAQDDFDAQSQTLRDAQARLELARVHLENRTVKAPFAGILGVRQVSPGALVQPGGAIVSLDAIDSLRAEFQVPETQLAAIAVGNAVTGHAAAYPQREFRGAVTLIGTRVDEGTRTFTVQARIDNRSLLLKPGMLLTVSAQAKARPALFVPEAAVVPEGNNQFVWRARDDGTAERIAVVLGVRKPGFVEITAGLQPGEQVVTEGQGALRPGQTIRVAQADAAGKP